MNRETLRLIPLVLVAMAVSVAFWIFASRTLGPPAVWRAEPAQGLTLEVPAGTLPFRQVPGSPWTATEFHAGILGTLRVAREQPQGDLEPALTAWFQLPGPLAGPVTYRARGQLAQARPVTAFGPAGHLVQRQGRQLAMVLVFDLDGSRYWVQARTATATPAAVASFRHVLLSLRGPRGEGPDPALARDLAAAEAGLAPGLVQDQSWVRYLPFLPLLGALAVVVLTLGTVRLSGRPPRDLPALGSRYDEAPVEVCLAFRMQRKFLWSALVVTGDRLLIHTFGTLFLSVPLAPLSGNVVEKSSWLGPPYLELTCGVAPEMHKYRWVYGHVKSPCRLRIYTRDGLRLRAALGA